MFQFEKPEDSPGFLLWQTTTIWQRLIKKALEPFGVSHSQFVILAILLWFEEQDANATQSDLVNLSKLDKMTVSKSLKKLVLQKLVKRKEHKEDTRAKNVKLSSQGKDLICELIPLVEGLDGEFFGDVSLQEQKALVKTLGKLAKC